MILDHDPGDEDDLVSGGPGRSRCVNGEWSYYMPPMTNEQMERARAALTSVRETGARALIFDASPEPKCDCGEHWNHRGACAYGRVPGRVGGRR